MSRPFLSAIVLLIVCRPPLRAAEPKPAPIALPATVLATQPSALAKQWQRERDAEKAIEEALGKTITLECLDEKLDSVVEFLRAQLQIQIQIHRSVPPSNALNVPIKFAMKKVSARSALTAVLEPLDLDWFIQQEVLWIATTSEGQGIRTSVYPVRDLVEIDGDVNFDSLIELITSVVQPSSWEAAGGLGDIKGWELGRLLVIRQTRRGHEDIEKFLLDARAAMKSERQPSLPQPQPKPTATPAKPTSRVENPPDIQSVVTGSNQFACDLYQKLCTPGKNVVFSPLSITTALSMTYAGAREETAKEIERTLHIHLEPDRFHRSLNTLRTSLFVEGGNKDSLQLSLANRLFVQRDYPLLDAFLEVTRDRYGATVGQVDFQRPAGRREINDWVAEQTQQKIKELLPPSAIPSQTEPRIVLVNAIYFKGKWKDPFLPEATRPGNFFVAADDGKSTSVPVPFMHREALAKYAKAEDVQILEMPYVGTSLAMDILLPSREALAFTGLQGSLSAEKLDRWFALLKPRLVSIHLPKFTLVEDAPLISKLAELGVKRLFDKKTVDLSGIDGRTGADATCITDAYHRALIDVNEEGTEAAAATGFGGALGGGIAPKPISFRADHPFVFLIRDTRTGSIVFLGHLENPK